MRRVEIPALAIAAFLIRADSFGDPVANVVDQFYLLVGKSWIEGLLPYVDIWDRKPPGIFAIYALIAAISTAPIFYQVIATMFAGATAIVIRAIALRWAGRGAAFLAGLLYLATLGMFNGDTGEAAVFYNLPVAIAVLLILSERYRPAMLSLGLALAVKQTVAVEAAALGLYAVSRAGWREAPRFIALGIAPTLLLALPFAGHFAEYWQATVTSIFSKGGSNSADVLGRGLDIARRFIPLIALATMSFALPGRFAPYRRFMALWLASAAIGVAIVPQLYPHYGLPLVLPLAIAAATALDRPWIGPALALLALLGGTIYDRPFRFEAHAQSRAEIAAVVGSIDALPGNTLLVFDGPSALYTLTGRKFLSPLVFPAHLNDGKERNVSGIDTNRALERMLARADVIVLTEKPRNWPENGWEQVRARVAGCRWAGRFLTHEMGSQYLLVYACN
jgi:hypothetical protein